ncbi:MAG: wax ester/triacylglycerol synthase family O-acyltransferase [Candidatus Binatus sp.]|jgi:WS/DGAT/MGAT family acyltransferase|uniref:wax ester/triacylglycerol synthase family O-acyltransferase n=1 Tax=Candidatus Binatus sp. TaxID=2811406 RepID=UPI003D0F7BCE
MPEKSIPTKKLSHRLTGQDSSFIYGESRNGPLHIGSLSFFEDQITYPELIRHFESKLHLLPRYRQRLVQVPFNFNHATFEDDPDFRIENHIKLHQLAADTSEAQLIDAAMAVFRKPLDLNRPLWEAHLFNGFKGNRSVIMWPVHHCLVDGVSGMELLNVVLDFRPNPPATESKLEPWSPKPLPGPLRQVIDATLDRAQAQLDSMRRLSQMALNFRSSVKDLGSDAGTLARLARQLMRPIAAAPWNAGLVSQERTMAWLRTSFADVRAIRAAFGGTINDVVLTMLSEGAARYLRYHGGQPGAPLRIGCPVNVRRDDESGSLGNRVSMMLPELPAEPMDPVARLKLVAAETQRIKEAGEPQALERLMSNGDGVSPALVAMLAGIVTAAMDTAVSLQRIFPSWAKRAAQPLGISFVATNVPGSQVPLYLAGHRMADYVGLLPLGGNLGFGVTIVSYNQDLYFTVMAAPNLMPDPDRMKSLVEEVFKELKQAAVAKSVPAAVQPSRVQIPIYTGMQPAGAIEPPHPAHPGVAALRAH